jgi:hypothetical protein
MEPKVIVEKVLKDEKYYNSDAYKADIALIPEDQRTSVGLEINKAITDAANAEQTRLIGLREAGKKIGEEQKEKKEGFDKIKSEQLTVATTKFFSDPKFSGLDEAGKAAVLAQYAKDNSGAVDASLIFNDLKKAFGYVNSDRLIDDAAELARVKLGAVRFNGNGANQGGGLDTKENEKYSREAKELYQEWRNAGFNTPAHTLDAAQKAVDTQSKNGKLVRKLG